MKNSSSARSPMVVVAPESCDNPTSTLRVVYTPSSQTIAGREELAREITEQLMQVRRTYVKSDEKRCRQPKEQYVADLRRDINSQKARPIHMLLAIAFTDLQDGAPVEAVARTFETMAAMVRARAAEIRHEGIDTPSLLAPILRENRAEAAQDEAELRVLDEPTEANLALLEQRGAEYDKAQDDMIAVVRGRRAVMAVRRQLAGVR